MSGPEHTEINKTESGTAQHWVGGDLEINNYLTVCMEQRMTNSVKEEETKEQVAKGRWGVHRRTCRQREQQVQRQMVPLFRDQ